MYRIVASKNSISFGQYNIVKCICGQVIHVYKNLIPTFDKTGWARAHGRCKNMFPFTGK